MRCFIDSFAQSGGNSYRYNYTDSIEVVEVIEVEVIEAVESLDYVDYSLYGIIKKRDWDRLVLDRYYKPYLSKIVFPRRLMELTKD